MTKTGSVKGSESGYALPTTVGLINHDTTYRRAPAYSMGPRFEVKVRSTPGPQYKLDDMSPRGGFSITGRPKRSIWGSNADKTPGPNQYNVQENRVSHSFSIGAPHHEPKRSQYPAPNAYSVPHTLGNRYPTLPSGPASTIKGKGSKNKGFAFDNSRTPGPAAYYFSDLSLTTPRAPAVTMKSRPKLPPISTDGPGPAGYDQDNDKYITKHSPRFSMGIRHGDKVRPLYTNADV